MRLLRTKLSRWKAGQMHFLVYCLFFMANIVLSISDEEFCSTACVCLKPSGIVNCSSKALTDVPEYIPIWTKKLILDNNRLTSSEVTHYDFTKLGLLEELYLGGDKITNLSLDLSGNPAIQKISAPHCSLTTFPHIHNNDNVTMLELSHNSISELSLTGYPNLESLDLSFNKIRQIKQDDFLTLSKLKNLFLQRNRISTISWEVFSGVTSIENLDLSRNRIRNISKPQRTNDKDLCGGNLQTLQHLDLSHNRLGGILSLTFSGMCSLDTLRLDHNRISQLKDGAFYGLKAMKTLMLDNNFIGYIKKGWLYKLSSLETLSVAFNNLTKLDNPEWSFCKELVHLNLSHNGLSSLETGDFIDLERLRSLNLSFNKISMLPDFAFKGLTQLRTLDLSNNAISSGFEDIDGGFLGLDSIEELLLRNNRIRTLSASALEGVETVRKLDFCGNDITSIHNHTFEKMTNLKTLSIVSSSFLCDCQLAWFPAWLRDINNTRQGFIYNIQGKCFHPETLQGRDILNISEEEFVCVDNPMPLLLQEPLAKTALKGDNVTFACRASAMFTAPQNTSQSSPTFVRTTTITNLVNERPGNPLIDTPGIPLHDDINPAESPMTMEDAPEARRLGGFPLKADETKTPEKRKKPHKRRDASRPTDGMAVMWKRSGRIIEASSHIEIRRITRQHGGYLYVTSLLILKDVTSDDNGKYKCIVANDYGYAHSGEAGLVVNQFPKFTKAPPNLIVVVNGSSPVLQCGATGQPPPLIQWQKDGGQVFPAATERRLLRQQSSDHVPLIDNSDYGESDDDELGGGGMMLKPDRTGSSNEKENKFTVDTDAPLEFDVVLPKDSGEYECVVESIVGKIVAKAMLIVEIAPTFSKQLPISLKSFVGSSVVFLCPGEGVPEPQINWSFNGLPFNVTSQHFLADDKRMLILTDIQSEDSGKYSCSAVNKHGKVFHTTTLDVTEDADETILVLLKNGDLGAWAVALCLVIAILTCLLVALLSCICYRRRQKEKAMSTNTDETDVEPGHLDTNSYSSDGSVRRGQSAHSMHMVGDALNNHQELIPDVRYAPLQRHGSASVGDISLMRIRSPGNASNSALLPNGKNTPQLNHSTTAVEGHIPISRYRSAESFKMNEQERYVTTSAGRTSQSITSPSATFAKKAAGVDNYVPVVLKNRSNGSVTTPSSEKTEKKQSSTKSKNGINVFQPNKRQPKRLLPNGVATNSRMTEQIAVAGPRPLIEHSISMGNKPSDEQNIPHRDRRKVTSQSHSDPTNESSALLLRQNSEHSNTDDIPRTSISSVNDRLLT